MKAKKRKALIKLLEYMLTIVLMTVSAIIVILGFYKSNMTMSVVGTVLMIVMSFISDITHEGIA